MTDETADQITDAIPAAHRATPAGKPRARSLGIPFAGTPGAANAITDVPGLTVGHTTRIEGDDVRTGVTAILPRGVGGVADPCAAGTAVLNGNGEMTGTAWIEEAGQLTLPIAISSTRAVGAVHDGVVRWCMGQGDELKDGWLLPVVAETWDGYLNDPAQGCSTAADTAAAIDGARGGPIEEGSVGGGTGMNCYAFAGGAGTASRLVRRGATTYTVGAYVQANFGARHELTIAGVPVGASLLDDDPFADGYSTPVPPGAGSVIAIVATDAPLLPGQCKALARRVPMGLARTGTTGSHFSGDLFLAFSTANAGATSWGITAVETADDGRLETLEHLPWGRLDDLFAAVAHAIEEAVLNALVANEEMHGRKGRRMPALPRDRVVELLRRR